jgi:hypothetical protein
MIHLNRAYHFFTALAGLVAVPVFGLILKSFES